MATKRRKPNPPNLSRRERQIMDVIWRRGNATAAQVRDELEDPPSYSAVRALLRVLVEKGHLSHEKVDNKYVYEPTVAPDTARSSAMRHMLRTFFGDSPARAVAAMLDDPDVDYSEDELEHMARMIRDAKGRDTKEREMGRKAKPKGGHR